MTALLVFLAVVGLLASVCLLIWFWIFPGPEPPHAGRHARH